MRCFSALALGLSLLCGQHLAWAQATATAPAPIPSQVPSQAIAVAPSASALPGSSSAVVDQALPQALTATAGDATRGRAIVANRQVGLCLLCHTGPIPEERFQGNLAPDLAGAGKRWSAGQLRLRMVDARTLNPQTIMPPYHRIDALNRVAPAWAGAPMLAAQQIEDVVAYLLTLRD